MSDDPRLRDLLRRCEPFVALQNAMTEAAIEHNKTCSKPTVEREELVQFSNGLFPMKVGAPSWFDVDPNTMTCLRCGEPVAPREGGEGRGGDGS